MKPDPVNHPTHYCSHPSQIECIEISEQMSFTAGNAFKYLYRCGNKGYPKQDLEKAIWYVERELGRRSRKSWLQRLFAEPPEGFSARLDGDNLIRSVVEHEHRFAGHASAALGHLWTANFYPRSIKPLLASLSSLRACKRIQTHKDDQAV